MKRFYCTDCKKVKRVQNYPTRIVNTHLQNVTLRMGKCNHHPDSFHSYQKVGK